MISQPENEPKKRMRKPVKIKITIYKDKKSEYRWNMKRCGKIIAESGEGYKRFKGCTKTLSALIASLESCQYSFIGIDI